MHMLPMHLQMQPLYPRHLFKGTFIVPRGAFKNTHLKHNLKKPSSSFCVSLSLFHYLCYWSHYLRWINQIIICPPTKLQQFQQFLMVCLETHVI